MGSRMSWPEFSWLLSGAFAVESRLSRHFTPDQEPEGGDDR